MSTNFAQALSPHRPFNLLTRQELERVSSYCSQRRLRAGALVDGESEWIDHLWLMTGGFMRASVQNTIGGQCTVGIMRTGDLVGCLDGVCRHRHPMEGMALTDASFIVIPRRRYLELLAHKDFAQAIIQILGERLWDCQQLRAASLHDSPTRLAWTLLWLYGKLGRRIPMTRRLIAEAAGVARETSIRILSPMEKKGWLKTRRGLLELIRPDKLKESLETP